MLGQGPLAERRERFAREFDHYRTAVLNEPRGSDVIVGAVTVPPHDPQCAVGVIFFNNASYLGMCGHGTIGLMATLHHMGQVGVGEHWVETPVGPVRTVVHDAHRVTVHNVPSYRYRQHVSVDVDGFGTVSGDIAWGGNWFFLIYDSPEQVTLKNLSRLTEFTQRVRAGLERAGITGAEGAIIDHIEVFGPGEALGADSQNFVLCPGGAYDRSPCGTGTSAKLACLAADGKLAPGEIYRQASIIGSIFEASYEWSGERIIPAITGTAYVCGDNRLLFTNQDPFIKGILS